MLLLVSAVVLASVWFLWGLAVVLVKAPALECAPGQAPAQGPAPELMAPEPGSATELATALGAARAELPGAVRFSAR